MYCKIGYLLGIKPDGTKHTIIIELNNKLLELSTAEYFCWISIGTDKFKDFDTPPEIIDNLLHRDLIIEMPWNDVSMQKLFEYKLVRQGLGILNDAENSTYCVFASNEGVNTLSELQMMIWQKLMVAKQLARFTLKYHITNLLIQLIFATILYSL